MTNVIEERKQKKEKEEQEIQERRVKESETARTEQVASKMETLNPEERVKFENRDVSGARHLSSAESLKQIINRVIHCLDKYPLQFFSNHRIVG